MILCKHRQRLKSACRPDYCDSTTAKSRSQNDSNYCSKSSAAFAAAFSVSLPSNLLFVRSLLLLNVLLTMLQSDQSLFAHSLPLLQAPSSATASNRQDLHAVGLVTASSLLSDRSRSNSAKEPASLPTKLQKFSKSPWSLENATQYLQMYGYLSKDTNSARSATANDEWVAEFSEALTAFQRFAQIPDTGVLDETTIGKMSMARCGVEDIGQESFQELREPSRSKRYTIEGSYWGVKDLTYKISKYTKNMSPEKVEKVIEAAFKVWEENSPLTFTRRDYGPANIEIGFFRGAHGDGEPFDGRGQILAHAFFPRYGGDVHFDDDEPWVAPGLRGSKKLFKGAGSLIRKIVAFFSAVDNLDSMGIDLYSVASHEIGHSLGLKHSNNHDALMAPFYHSNTGNQIRLHPDDIKGLQNLYGKTDTRLSTRSEDENGIDPSFVPKLLPPPIDLPSKDVALPLPQLPSGVQPDSLDFDICQSPSVDAITVIGNGTTYAFKGELYWKLNERSYERGFPRRIRDDWDGLPGNIDAAVTDADGDTYFFKGDLYWLMNANGRRYRGYPRKIATGLVDMPDNIDAAMIWNYDDKPYFFKGGQYWQYSRWGMPPSWPRSIKRISPILPDRIDAAFKWSNGQSYLFAGQHYYRLSGWRIMKVVAGYPRDVGEWWFGCKRSPEFAGRRSKRDTADTDYKEK